MDKRSLPGRYVERESNRRMEKRRGKVTNSESVKRRGARVCVPVPEIGLMAAVSFYLMGGRRGAGERGRDDRVSTGRRR